MPEGAALGSPAYLFTWRSSLSVGGQSAVVLALDNL